MASPDWASLEAEVKRNTEVDASAIALLNGIEARIEAAIAGGMPAVKSMLAELKQQNDALSAAVAANTPGNP